MPGSIISILVWFFARQTPSAVLTPQVDVALITHFHLDHCAAVPYLLSKTRFKACL
jgi:Cft2 family RNA processing exonuclease